MGREHEASNVDVLAPGRHRIFASFAIWKVQAAPSWLSNQPWNTVEPPPPSSTIARRRDPLAKEGGTVILDPSDVAAASETSAVVFRSGPEAHAVGARRERPTA